MVFSEAYQVEEFVIILILAVCIEWTVVASLLLPFSMEVICHHVDEVKTPGIKKQVSGVDCCLMTSGLSKDIRCHERQLLTQLVNNQID